MATKSIARSFHSLPHPARQMAGVFFSLIAFFFFVCFITYNQADPSLNRSSPTPVTNAGGYIGALVADLALQVLGLAGAMLVAVPMAWGVKLLTARPVSYLWLRFTLMLCGMVTFSSLLSMIDPPASWPISSGLGGSIGALLHDRSGGLFKNFAFDFAMIFATIAMLSIAFGMNWQEWKSVGRVSRHVFTVVCAALVSLRYLGRKRDDDEFEDEYEDDPDNLPWYRRVGPAMSSGLMFWKRDGDGEEEEDEEVEEDAPAERKPKKTTPRISKKTPEKAEKGGKSSKGQSSLALPVGDFELPPMHLLNAVPKQRRSTTNEASLTQNARLLETVLQDFGVQGDIPEIRPGPVVTLYELEPAAGTKSSRVIGLADDIARSMSAVSARIAVIPGRNAIGVELPNATRETVFLRELVESDGFNSSEAKLPLALGKDIGGQPITVDLTKMPHLLVAGTTGSGKSVAINTMIMSLVFKLSPEECKFIMIDPKMLELSIYDGIPHLLTPVVTEPGKAVVALKWTVKEMENRYRLMSNLGVRNIDGYNKKIREAKAKGKQLTRSVQTGFDPETGQPIIEEVELEMADLPYIVVVVDEMADLMLVAGKDIESSVQRLAQMARAAGIHIIMATQRPSVDVITGVIKANFPTRISFQVTSKIDSRTILGEQGAEQLLGQGDMLYMAGGGRITRVHGPFVSDREVEMVVEHLKEQGEPTYIEDVTRDEEEQNEMFEGEGERDEMYDQAVAIVTRDRKASTSYIQRCLKIGYNRAATIIERMEREGVVGPANHVGKREVLARDVDA